MQAHDEVLIRNYPNGITLLGERMPGVASAALSILVPVGVSTDPVGQVGAASVLAEMFHKGAGDFDSRALAAEFENIGAQRSHSSGTEVSYFSAAVLGQNLAHTLRLMSTVLLQPRLPDDELDNVRQLALQELKSLEDEPSQKVMVELTSRLYPEPWGRCQLGTEAGLQAITPQNLRSYFKERYVADRVIIGVAGRFDWQQIQDVVGECFGTWGGSNPPVPYGSLPNKSSVHHLQRETSQLQIALAYPSVSVADPDHNIARVANGVLSGGMSGRLFIEVREKRGLVYRVSSSYSAAVGRSAVFVYAGTTPENGETCLRVIINELNKLGDDVTDEELRRSKADLKSKIVMSLESSSGRASSLVSEYFNLKRVRTLEEVKHAIDSVTRDDFKHHFASHPVSPITLVTLGSKSLELPA